MKVEVELFELERLRAEARNAKLTAQSIEEKMKEISEEEMTRKAVDLSRRLFDNYMEAVFKQLGFDTWEHNTVVYQNDVAHFIGKSWWNSDRIKFDLDVRVIGNFRRAFLNVGIITKEQAEVKDEKSNQPYEL